MGKKSKKGVSRAGRTQRPAAGQGKTRRSSGRDDGSRASRDTLSVESGEPPMPPPLSTVLPSNIALTPPREGKKGEEEPTPAPVTSSSDDLEYSQSEAGDEVVVTESIPSLNMDDKVWDSNLRDQVSPLAEPQAVLDVTGDEGDDEQQQPESTQVSAYETLVSPETSHNVKERALDLSQPAEAEAAQKQKDCACVIL